MRRGTRPCRVLVLPGIGDIYWVAVALRALRGKLGLGDRPVSLHCWDFDGRRRGGEFIDRVPGVANGGYYERGPHPHKLREFRQSYHTGERSIFPGLWGFDYYVAPNGALRHGRTVGEAFGVDDAAIDWHLALRETEAELAWRAEYRRLYGGYALLHFSAFGMFAPWVKAWPAAACASFVEAVAKETGLTPLLTGREWDAPFAEEVARASGAITITGETDPDQFFGLLGGAAACAGWCGGNTILAARKIPTLMGWSAQAFPNRRFYETCVPPDSPAYRPIVVEEVTWPEAVDQFLGALEAAPC